MFVSLATAVSWKGLLLGWGKFPFNSDEAVVGLMAKHILAGSTPVFFYGQTYMGSLDAYFVAAGFLLLGQHVWVIRFVQTVLYALVVFSSMWITVKITDKQLPALITGLLLAIPTVNVTLYTTVSLGGYNEALLLGNLLLLSTFGLLDEFQVDQRIWKFVVLIFIYGFLSGVGIWANGLTLIYIIPTAGFLAYVLIRNTACNNQWRRFFSILLSGIAGLFAGSFPYWMYGIVNGFQLLVNELLGSAVSVEQGNLLQLTAAHFRNLLLLGVPAILGIRPPWAVRWLIIPMIPIVIFSWGWVFWKTVRFIRIEKKRFIIRLLLLISVCLVLIGGFLFTSFGVDPSGRYFVPLYIVMAILSGIVCGREKAVLGKIVPFFLLLFHLLSTLQCALSDPPAITTQFYEPAIVDHSYDKELIGFLKENEEFLGYSNYWVAYPLAFLSGEEMIYIPRLPYHPDMRYTSRDDRYAPYQEIVDQSERIAYITTNHDKLNGYLRDSFYEKGISWKEKQIGDYFIFYNLSDVIRPEDIGLGKASGMN